MMNNCPNCGSKLEAESKVCPVCGYVLQQKIPRGDHSTQGEENEQVAPEAPVAKDISDATVAETKENEATAKSPEEPAESAPANADSDKLDSENPEARTKPAKTSVATTDSSAEAEEESGSNHESAAKTEFTSEPESTEQSQPKTFKRPDLTLLNGGSKEEADDKQAGPGQAQKFSWENLDLPAQFLGYFRFLNQQSVAPKLNSEVPTKGAGKWYPLVSFLLLVLGNTFTLSKLLTSVIYRVSGVIQSFGLQLRYMGSGLLFFFDLTLYLLVAVGIFLGAYYVVAAKVFGRPVRFMQAAGEILAPASLAVYVSMLGAVFVSWLPVAGLTCVVASLLLFSVSFMGNLWQTPNHNGRFNRFYTTLLTLLLCFLVLSIISRFLVEGMIQDLPIRQIPNEIGDLFGDQGSVY